VILHVLQRDLDAGVQASFTHSPIAIAARRQGLPHAGTSHHTLYWDGGAAPLPREARRFLARFDAAWSFRAPTPFSFEIPSRAGRVCSVDYVSRETSTCELCGEPAGAGGALCPACAETR